jgi:hypothetical protein
MENAMMAKNLLGVAPAGTVNIPVFKIQVARL